MVLFDGSDDPICDLGLVPSPRFCAKLRRAGQHGRGDQLFKREESEMNAGTVAVDLAKNVCQLAVADHTWRVVETHRLTRAQLARWFANRSAELVVMEACGSARHWARTLMARGIAVKLVPPACVRAYVSTCDAIEPIRRTPPPFWQHHVCRL